ncbi:MAG: glycosyltransferase family 1 protein [Bryobacterales bacterium]|nr:glycosyltransferase family 1 protein [Bryobacterales bacterium]MBV9400686.1 glycosyltransferase family 1 protein [Bryobacterales bacterium]
MARVLFSTFGSFGDLHPYLAIGAELQKLGHRAVIATSAGYRKKIEAEGLGFAPIRPDVSLDDTETIQYFFDRRRGTERVIKAMLSVLRETYEDTLQAAKDAHCIVTHPLSFAAVIAAQKRKLPWVSSVLAPGSFLSAYEPPVPAPMPWLVKFRALGPAAMRAAWGMVTPMIRSWCKPVFELRRDLGLDPGGNPLFEGGNSPDLVLALFSHVFAQAQPDWPRQTLTTGFPFHDHPGVGLPRELVSFLDAGPPPAVFTLGSSAVAAAGDFYSISVRAIQRAGARALFLTGSQPQGLPSKLPENVLIWPYAPHEQLFCRASAIVHQGGIGTTAQALRSGRPMLVIPFAHDQYDNAARVQRIGAGISIPRNRYAEARGADALAHLLSDRSYTAAAAEAGRAIRAEHGAQTAAQAIERYVSQ